MTARLFVIPGSHPSTTARLMLERKGIPHRRVDLLPVVHKPLLRAFGFRGATVPALMLDGSRVQGSRAIARALERIRPDPPLFPHDPAERAAVEEAERFGDEALQPAVRRLAWWAFRRDSRPLGSFAEGARLGVPLGLALKTAPPLVRVAARFNGSTDEAARGDLAALPDMLDRVDAWIADGVMGREPPNAADLQIATSVRLLMTMDDLNDPIRRRPAGELARHLVSVFPGRIGPIFPRAWLEPLTRATPAGSS